MNTDKWFLLLFCILLDFQYVFTSEISRSGKSERSVNNNQVIDFRYNSARIDAITRLPNNTFMVVSNGYYWILNDRQTPRLYNLAGHVSQLYPKFKTIDAIFTDPINEVDPKIFLVSHSKRRGIKIACQEFDGQYDTHNTFCHLPVKGKWFTALKDLDLTLPIDSATWRNRSKDKDEGFWVFFQGTKMTVIDPYKMDLRFTYDINKWMGINETITATYYDYRTHSFHLFFNQNKYRIWKVNVSRMNSLPMGWDRAFLHGTLSAPLKINKDFFGFSDREIRDYNQPYFQEEVIDWTDDDVDADELDKEVVEVEEEKVKVVKEDVIEEKISNTLEQISHINSNKELQLITEMTIDLERDRKSDDNLLDVFKHRHHLNDQQSEEPAAISPVVATSAAASHSPLLPKSLPLHIFIILFSYFILIL